MNAMRLAAFLGFSGVVLGAFGAHGLQPLLVAKGTTAIWQTAVLYHLIHAVAALWASERSRKVVLVWALGVLIFSGSLYLLAVTGMKWLGAITPIGGLLFLAGWVMLMLRPAKPKV